MDVTKKGIFCNRLLKCAVNTFVPLPLTLTKLSKNVHLVGRCNQYQMFTCLAAGNVFMEHTQVSTAL